MKHKITLLFLLLTTISFAQIPSYVPSNGLVGWWPFNGNANDESGNGNNGTVNGATLTADRFGVADKAYSFDGVNDLISTSRNFITEFTVSLWFSSQGNQQYNPLIDAFDSNWEVQLKNNAIDYVSFINPSNYSEFVSSQTVNNGIWHHFIITNSQNQVYFYLDNVQIASYQVNTLINTNGNYFFGSSQSGSDQYFNGSLDDIGIWNRALTECEIKDLYYAQLGYSTVDAGADQTICRGDMVTLQGAGGSSLAWDNGVIDGVPFEPAQSGAYVLTGTDSLGCVGTDTVVVSVLENASSTINQTAIDSYTLNGQTYTQSGTYTQVVPAANGCDSVITLNLELDFTGIQSHTNTSLQLYPNPVKDIMTLVGLKGEAVSFAVFSVDGKLIKSGQTSGEIQLEDLKKGNYILKIENEALPFVKL